MIGRLSIQRFKSIESLTIECKRINLFIGPPDSGKTNILEALYLPACLGWGLPLGQWLRLGDLGFDPLFYRQFFDKPLSVEFGEHAVTGTFEEDGRKLRVQCEPNISTSVINPESQLHIQQFSKLRFYVYGTSREWSYSNAEGTGKIVCPPGGSNLVFLARHHGKVNELLKESVSALGWKVKFDPNQKRFRFSEVREEEIIEYNFDLLSDTVKRMFFYNAIINTSEEAILIFDEPDVYAFPPHPKLLGEQIAHDNSNQYFLTTHNPYFLSAIVEKSPVDDLALFVTYRDPKGATSAKLLETPEVQQVIELGPSIFFNLDQFIVS